VAPSSAAIVSVRALQGWGGWRRPFLLQQVSKQRGGNYAGGGGQPYLQGGQGRRCRTVGGPKGGKSRRTTSFNHSNNGRGLEKKSQKKKIHSFNYSTSVDSDCVVSILLTAFLFSIRRLQHPPQGGVPG
jgi:hypothetical protein